jgi:hypothetical protein
MLLGEARQCEFAFTVSVGERAPVSVWLVCLNGQYFTRIVGPWGTEHYPERMSAMQCVEAYWGITDSLEAAVAQLGRTLEAQDA